jgi:uncharacterized protein (TIGR02186 family)
MAAVSLGLFVLSAPTVSALTCEVSPSLVPITMSYHGAKLTITGTSGVNEDLVLKISSVPADSVMKYKAKVGGVFWMKKGSLDFKNVPGVYLLNSTADLSRILPAGARNQYQLGYESLAAAASVEDSNGEPVDGKWFNEFIRFKEREMVYDIQEGTITRRHGEESNTFEVMVDWPYQAPPGVYNVELLAVSNGTVVDQAGTTFEVQRVGIGAALSKMAFEQAALYGIMAVVIALAAGLAVGVIFKKGGGSH